MYNFYYKNEFLRLLKNIVWTHKIQCCYLEHLVSLNRVLKVIKVFVTFLLSLSTLLCIIFDQKSASVILSFLTALSALLTNLLDLVVSDSKLNDVKKNTNDLCKLRDDVLVNMKRIQNKRFNDDVVLSYLELYENEYFDVCSKLQTVSNKYVKIAKKKLVDRNDEDINLELFNKSYDI